MKISKISYPSVLQLAKTDVEYTQKNPSLYPFFKYQADFKNFKTVIEDKAKKNFERAAIVEVLRGQYSKIDKYDAVTQNIESLLNVKTFTVVTAHQPSLLLGPLYFVYKIISTIRLTRQLKSAFSDCDFVPIFVIGGEDHDFEEVNNIQLFGKKIEWKNEESGAVGLMQTDSLSDVISELEQLLGSSENAKYLLEGVKNSYAEGQNYFVATAKLINYFFGKYGLVTLNMSDVSFKKLFIPILKDELLYQTSKKLVDESIEKLSNLGFKTQAAPREINLFYLLPQLRERIVLEDGKYSVLNTNLVFTEAEMLAEVERFPERFSPNVVLRPLYQELILPNLAYVGGGGELAYWLERKSQFEHYGVNFPMLIRRNSALWIDKNSAGKIEKLGFYETEIFENTDKLIKDFIKKNAKDDITLTDEKNAFSKIFERIELKASKIDTTLLNAIAAEKVKQIAVINQLEAKLTKAEKLKHEVSIQQIKAIKDKLFPSGGLQERSDNFMSIFLKQGTDFFDILLENLDCLDNNFLIFSE